MSSALRVDWMPEGIDSDGIAALILYITKELYL